jgi:hypothetical protein
MDVLCLEAGNASKYIEADRGAKQEIQVLPAGMYGRCMLSDKYSSRLILEFFVDRMRQ